MRDTTEITIGMPVFGSDERPLGVVEIVDEATVTVGTLQIPRSAIDRVSAGAIHLRVAGSALAATPDYPEPDNVVESQGLLNESGTVEGDHLVVPIVEERLAAGVREVNLGEVEIRKRVVEETVLQPVTIRREVVEVVQRDAAGREIGAQEISPTPTPPEQQG